MKTDIDVLVIGAGPAGLAAAVAAKDAGVANVLIVERESEPGGILNQCVHNGFGLRRFKEELTGPEYAERCLEAALARKIPIESGACVFDIVGENDRHVVRALSETEGLITLSARAIILAMGCRERNRGNINIPGSRPAGIMTAGAAQKLINRFGYMPGKEIVILGSGDIGLIMARRLTWEGARVRAVVEIQPYPGGLNRNIVQCLRDFNIPLYLSHTVSNIFGNPRIQAVEVAPLDIHFEPRKAECFTIPCDTLLLSVGLIPENELSLKRGVVLDNVTGGPVVDHRLMTSVPGVFACGNVLQVHDLVDWVSEEAEACGRSVARYLAGESGGPAAVPVKAGNLVRYVLPARVAPGAEVTLSLRPMAPAENVELRVRAADGRDLYSKKHRKVFPSEMSRFEVTVPADAGALDVSFARVEAAS